jgi:hypothetical protein
MKRDVRFFLIIMPVWFLEALKIKERREYDSGAMLNASDGSSSQLPVVSCSWLTS